jgi:chemotaxis protein MotA
MKKADLKTFITFIICFTIFVFAVSSQTRISGFLDMPSFIITFVGSFLAVLLSYSFDNIKSIKDCFSILFTKTTFDRSKIVFDFIQISKQSRKKGLLGIEDYIDNLDNPLMQKGLEMILYNQSAVKIKKVLKTEIIESSNLLKQKISIFQDWAKYAPAFGMLGTLIGMIQIFSNMSDTTTIISGFDKAFLTTLYGILLANLVFLPIANKLSKLQEDEETLNEMILEGILNIKNDVNNIILREHLFSYLTKEEIAEYGNKVISLRESRKLKSA